MKRPRVTFATLEGKRMCHIETLPDTVMRGTLLSEEPDGDDIPLLLVQYDLGELDILSRMIKETSGRERPPQIYVWDTHEDPCKMVLVFILEDPSWETVRRVVGPEHTAEVQPWMAWGHVGLLAHMEMPTPMTLRFLERFRLVKTSKIAIIEKTVVTTQREFRLEDLDVMCTLTTNMVYQERFYK